MLTLLGSALGFFGSVVPNIFKFFEHKRDQEHEFKMVELQQRGVAAMAQQGLDLANVNADISEFRELQRSASVVTGTWVDALTASVRPIITYCFFALFAFVEIKTALTVWALQDLSILTKLGMVWNDEVQALFAAIMSFWFGSRSLEKSRKRG
jgi:hypothetical protein